MNLEQTATAWNSAHPIGTPVTRYALINPLRLGKDTKTRSIAWIVGGHSVMVMVDGVAGGVILESVIPLKKKSPTPTKEEKFKAKFEGTKAVAQGKKVGENPYPEESSLHWTWMEAWAAAKGAI